MLQHPVGVADRLLNLGRGEPRRRMVQVVLVPFDVVEDHRVTCSVLHIARECNTITLGPRADNAARKRGVDDPGDEFVTGGEQVTLCVDRGGDGLVAQPRVAVRQRSAPSDKPGHVGVAEIVELEWRDASAASAVINLRQTCVWKSPLCSGRSLRVVKTKSLGTLPSIRRARAEATDGEIEMVRRDFGVLRLPR